MMTWDDLDLDVRLSTSFRRVVSIVCGSRSGSTILKYALCLHPDLCSLAGEEEPYYKLTQNGYPWHESDEFHRANRPDKIRLMIDNELRNHATEQNRRRLQETTVEEPPFVDPIRCRVTDTLVLKTPQNVYRRGVIEQVFPEAEVVYLGIQRDGRAVVNGLLDGWQSDGMFLARKTSIGWWRFDMPPNWDFCVRLLDRCVNQYRQAKEFMSRDYPEVTPIWFEDFEADWLGVCRQIWGGLGLARHDVTSGPLPLLAATDPPRPGRWRDKRPWLSQYVEAR